MSLDIALDPQWVSVFVAIVYVAFTLLIVLESRKSRKNLEKREKKRIEREEERRKEHISQLRHITAPEILGNLAHLTTLLESIIKSKKGYKDGKVIPLYEFPGFWDIIYKTFLNRYDILPLTEAWRITEVYFHLDLIYTNYLSVKKQITAMLNKGLPKKDIIQLLDSLEKSVSGGVNLIDVWTQYHDEKLSGYELDRTLKRQKEELKKLFLAYKS